MTATRDRKDRPLTHSIITGAISGITRTILTWLTTHLHH